MVAENLHTRQLERLALNRHVQMRKDGRLALNWHVQMRKDGREVAQVVRNLIERLCEVTECTGGLDECVVCCQICDATVHLIWSWREREPRLDGDTSRDLSGRAGRLRSCMQMLNTAPLLLGRTFDDVL